MQITVEKRSLKLEHPFGISRWTRTAVDNVFISIRHQGITGIGEAAPNARYDESADSAHLFLSKLDGSNIINPYDVASILTYLDSVSGGEYAAKAGFEMALWDWIGKSLSLPLYKLWNAPGNIGPVSSFTIGLDSEDVIKQKVEEAHPYPVLKVKLGTENDKDIIKLIRSLTNKTFWIDANEGWKTETQASDMIRFLNDKNVDMIEQPVPASEGKLVKSLKSLTHIPLIADEGFTGKESLKELAEQYSGINIKLMKIGSMRKAMQTIAQARKLGMKIMIGCMIETALANSAGAILSLWADFADLDGFLLLKDKPFTGMSFNKDNCVELNDLPGLGVLAVDN